VDSPDCASLNDLPCRLIGETHVCLPRFALLETHGCLPRFALLETHGCLPRFALLETHGCLPRFALLETLRLQRKVASQRSLSLKTIAHNQFIRAEPCFQGGSVGKVEAAVKGARFGKSASATDITPVQRSDQIAGVVSSHE
jgi:hypothetical protein